MHKKKHKLSVNNNSIPIHQTLYSRKYLVFYSIPLSCMVALLLLGTITVNPSLSDLLVSKSSAVAIRDEWVVKGSNNSGNTDSYKDTNNSNKLEDEEKLNSSLIDSNTNVDADANENEDAIDDSFGGFGGDEINNTDQANSNISSNNDNTNNGNSSSNPGISLMSITTNPTVSLAISKTKAEASTVQGGSTAYATNTITLTGSYVKDYTLSIKAGSANLTMPSGASSSTSTVSGVGTTGVVGSSIGSNKWGYAVTDTSTTNYAGLTYKATPTSATTILSGAGNTESSTSMNVSKQLVFAAKFSSDVTPGTYSASITLSATATPKALTMVNITDMQDMTPEICAASSIGDTATLTDNRTTAYTSTTNTMTGASGKTHKLNQYEIAKLPDGHCWMQENLRVGKTSTVTLTSSNTNITKNYTLPASNDSSWATDETTGNGQIRVGKTSMTVNSAIPGDGKGWQSLYGNYYSWCAATASTCSEATEDNVNVSGSICPKGWHLPSSGDISSTSGDVGANGEFYKLFGSNSSGTDDSARVTAIKTSPYYYTAAGFVSSGLNYPGTRGYYWSRTSVSNSSAYDMRFESKVLYTSSTLERRNGFSVRCVADY